MENLPVYISLLMILITFLTVFIFYKASGHSKEVLIILAAWLALQAILGLSGFYTNVITIPPRFILTVVPPLLFILTLFITSRGRKFLDSLDPKLLTSLHIVRIPVEIVLFLLFLYKTVPALMTFEGKNFDILSGLSAPLIFFFGYKKKILSKKTLLAWNFICLGLLVNIVGIAILAAPFPFQQLAFDQPNIAVLYFPFVWLPACVVPLVLLSHLASIRQLLKKSDCSR